MKIAISGASGTGKTTLARALANKLSLPLVEEGFGELVQAALHYNQVQSETDTEKLRLQHNALREYKKSCFRWLRNREQIYSAHSGYVADRCGFDILCRWTTARVPFDTTTTLQQLIAYCQQESRRFDLMLIPPLTEWSMQPGSNESGLQRRHSLKDKLHSHSTLIGLIQQFSTGPYLLLSARSRELDTTDDRIDEILTAITSIRKHSRP